MDLPTHALECCHCALAAPASCSHAAADRFALA
jgi:hypothetical protein